MRPERATRCGHNSLSERITIVGWHLLRIERWRLWRRPEVVQNLLGVKMGPVKLFVGWTSFDFS